MSETKVPSIPAVTDGNLRDVARILKMIMDVREGRAGDPLDANVTYRDLISSGAVKVRPGWTPSSAFSPVIPAVIEDDGYDPANDFTTPPAPTGVSISSGIALTRLRWDVPTYQNHAYTEVWRSEDNVLGNAIFIGTSDTRFYVDALGETGVSYRYWVRHVSQANVRGPYNATGGTLAQPGLIDSADIAFLDAAKITTGFIDADRIQVGTLDAKIANISAAVITSGTLNIARIADGTITTAKIADTIQSTNFTPGLGGAGWRIDKTGNMEINTATFRGVIDVRSAANGARLEIRNNVIKVFDTNGILRVKIGDLAA